MRDFVLPAICRNMIFILNSHINGLGGGVNNKKRKTDATLTARKLQ